MKEHIVNLFDRTKQNMIFVQDEHGNTFGLRDSFNVSSATDQGTGDYTINFSNSMSNDDYSVSVNAGDVGKSVPRICACGTSQDTGFATSSHGIISVRPDTLAIDDMQFVNSSVHGDLAWVKPQN